MNAMTSVHVAHSRRSAGFAALVGAGVALALVPLVIGQAVKGLAPVPNPTSSAAAAKAEGWAKDSLSGNHLDARALRILALKEGGGDSPKAAEMMLLARSLSKRDTVVEAWLFDHYARQQDFAKAFDHADVLLREDPDLADQLFPILGSVAASPQATKHLASRLTLEPSWRTPFLAFLSEKGDPNAAFGLLQALNQGKTKPTDAEAGALFQRLISLKQYEPALLAWLLLAPPDRIARFDGLYDGAFDNRGGPAPFNWSLTGGVGGTVDVSPAPDRPGDNTLHVNYDGYSNVLLASQVVVLSPGAYRITGEAKFVPPLGSQNLAWSIACLENEGVVLGKGSSNPAQSWQSFSIPFEVPSEGCTGQILRLIPVSGERRTSIDAWYDKIAIQTGNGAPGPETR